MRDIILKNVDLYKIGNMWNTLTHNNATFNLIQFSLFAAMWSRGPTQELMQVGTHYNDDFSVIFCKFCKEKLFLLVVSQNCLTFLGTLLVHYCPFSYVTYVRYKYKNIPGLVHIKHFLCFIHSMWVIGNRNDNLLWERWADFVDFIIKHKTNPNIKLW